MKLWIAKLLFNLDQASAAPPVMEEKILIIRAQDAADAWEMARQFGIGEEEEFTRNGALIRWKFEGILEVESLPDAGIAEIDSRELTVAEFGNKLKYARHRIENTRQEINCSPLSGIMN